MKEELKGGGVQEFPLSYDRGLKYKHYVKEVDTSRFLIHDLGKCLSTSGVLSLVFENWSWQSLKLPIALAQSCPDLVCLEVYQPRFSLSKHKSERNDK